MCSPICFHCISIPAGIDLLFQKRMRAASFVAEEMTYTLPEDVAYDTSLLLLQREYANTTFQTKLGRSSFGSIENVRSPFPSHRTGKEGSPLIFMLQRTMLYLRAIEIAVWIKRREAAATGGRFSQTFSISSCRRARFIGRQCIHLHRVFTCQCCGDQARGRTWFAPSSTYDGTRSGNGARAIFSFRSKRGM